MTKDELIDLIDTLNYLRIESEDVLACEYSHDPIENKRYMDLKHNKIKTELRILSNKYYPHEE